MTTRSKSKAKPAKEKKPRKKPPIPSGPAVVVLLSSTRELADVRLVARNGKTTLKRWFARDFETKAKAEKFIKLGFVPKGYRGQVDVVERDDHPSLKRPSLGGYTQTTIPSF